MTTLADLKTLLNISGTGDDAALSLTIAAAAESIEDYCNRKFAQSAGISEYHDGGGQKEILVERPPIDSQTFAIYDKGSDEDFDATDDIIDHDDFEIFWEEGRIVYRESTFDKYVKNVQVDYTGGFATLPESLKMACRITAGAWFTRGKQQGFGIKSEGVQDYRVVYQEAGGIPPEAKALLEPLRLLDRSNG